MPRVGALVRGLASQCVCVRRRGIPLRRSAVRRKIPTFLLNGATNAKETPSSCALAQDIGVSCEARNIWADGLGEREDYTPEERTSGGSMT